MIIAKGELWKPTISLDKTIMVNTIHPNTVNTKILIFTVIGNPINPGLQLQETKIPGTMPQDLRVYLGENTTNNSLLNILDTQCKVQQETTQALSTIIKLQDTRANDAFLSDLHSFNGKPDEFLKWIAAIERVANVTGRPARELATAKAEGAVFKCLQGISHLTDWEGCKKILRESFSNIQTKEHANSFLMGHCQRPNESLQEYIHVFAKLAKITTGIGAKTNNRVHDDHSVQ